MMKRKLSFKIIIAFIMFCIWIYLTYGFYQLHLHNKLNLVLIPERILYFIITCILFYTILPEANLNHVIVNRKIDILYSIIISITLSITAFILIFYTK